MKRLVIIITVVYNALNLYSQDIIWSKDLNKWNIQQLVCVRATPDGGCVVGAVIYSGKREKRNEDMLVVKIDKNGREKWSKTWGDSGSDYLCDVKVGKDGNVVVLSSKTLSKGKDSTTIKLVPDVSNSFSITTLSKNGKIKRQQSYALSNLDFIQRMLLTEDGGVLVGGRATAYDSIEAKKTFKSAAERADYLKFKGNTLLIKIDAENHIDWRTTYDIPNSDEFLGCLAPASGGGYLMGGGAFSNLGKNADFLLKVDAAGILREQKNRTDTLCGRSIQDVCATLDGGMLLGCLSSIPGRKADYGLIKLDSRFQSEWVRYYGSPNAEVLRNVIPLKDGTYLLSGEKGQPDNNNDPDASKLWLVRVDIHGNVVSVEIVGKHRETHLTNAESSPDGSVILAGEFGHAASFCDWMPTNHSVKKKEKGGIYVMKVSVGTTKNGVMEK